MIINPKEKFKRKNRKKIFEFKKFHRIRVKRNFWSKDDEKIRAADKKIEPFRDSEGTHVSEINSVNEFFFSDSDNSIDLQNIYFDNDYPFPSILQFSEDFKNHFSFVKNYIILIEMDNLNKQYKTIVRNVKLKSWEKIAKLKKENRQLESLIRKRRRNK